MSRYKIVIQYDGTNFSGFQSQKNQSGIQDNIESSISKLNNDKKIKIYGASRTDAGVHALGQVAHFDLDSKFSESELLKALNARLSKEIRISHLTKVNENFHSRFDATSKEYHYLCSLTDNPLHLRNHFQVKNLDFDLLGAQIEACHEIGVLAPLYYTFGWSHIDAIENKEWIARQENGKYMNSSQPYDLRAKDDTPKPSFQWFHMCVNTSYHDHIMKQIEEICQLYPVDGLWFDIYQVANPVSYTHLTLPTKRIV